MWIQSRKKLLIQVKGQILSVLGRDLQVDQYAKSYAQEFKGNWKESSHEVMKVELAKFKIVLGGDFHAFSQAQRTHLRIIRDWPQEKPLILALECFEARDQSHLDKFMSDKISEERLLQLVEWSRRWSFPWSHYRPLLVLAKSRGIKVYGINKFYKRRTKKSLICRDDFAAQRISRLALKSPQATIYVIYGDLHLAADHMPLVLKKHLKSSGREIAKVFQNSERLYFKLVRQGRELDVDVLKKNQNSYCVMSSPPWVKWQSYLMFLEGAHDANLDEEDFEVHDYIVKFAKIMCSDLGIKGVNYNDLSVYTSDNYEVLEKVSLRLDLWTRNTFFKLIEGERSFFLPQINFYYLSRYSINHCAHVAAFFIHAKKARLNQQFWRMPNEFLTLIWVEAMAFFLSKLINHKRKADNLMIIKSRLTQPETKSFGRQALSLVLDQKTDEWIYIRSGRRKKTKYKSRDPVAYIEAAKILGSILGEKIYKSYHSGRLTKKEVRSLLAKKLGTSDFENFYYFAVKKFEAHNLFIESRKTS